MQILVDEIRALVPRAATRPGNGRWQVIVVEDADRLNERASDALLKSLEEPASRTVWMLCAPSVEDLQVPTVRSRCRQVSLRTPPAEAITRLLVERDGVAEGIAAFAARASHGHIGRARRLATDENARNRRREVVALAPALFDLGACMTAAQNLHETGQGGRRRGLRAPRRGGGQSARPGLGGVAGSPRPGPRAVTSAPPSELKDDQRRRARRV
jgi:DNA polymerase-3 subunit delta'